MVSKAQATAPTGTPMTQGRPVDLAVYRQGLEHVDAGVTCDHESRSPCTSRRSMYTMAFELASDEPKRQSNLVQHKERCAAADRACGAGRTP